MNIPEWSGESSRPAPRFNDVVDWNFVLITLSKCRVVLLVLYIKSKKHAMFKVQPVTCLNV
jgi:hypothetical protein